MCPVASRAHAGRLRRRQLRARADGAVRARPASTAGHLPMTSWFPYLGLGSPQFLHYQGLPAMLTGVLGLATGGDSALSADAVPPARRCGPCRCTGRPGSSTSGGAPRSWPRRPLPLAHERGGRRLRAQGLRLDRLRGVGPAVGVVDASPGVGLHVAGHVVTPRRAARRWSSSPSPMALHFETGLPRAHPDRHLPVPHPERAAGPPRAARRGRRRRGAAAPRRG